MSIKQYPINYYHGKVDKEPFSSIKEEVFSHLEKKFDVFYEPFPCSNVKCDFPVSTIDKKQIYEVILDHFKKYVNSDHLDLDTIQIYEVWLNSTKKGEFQYLHDHVGNSSKIPPNKLIYSGTIYIQTSKKSGEFSFSQPDGTLLNKFIPEESDIIIFPGFLLHAVFPILEENIQRLSIAFNILATKKNDPWYSGIFNMQNGK